MTRRELNKLEITIQFIDLFNRLGVARAVTKTFVTD